MFCTRGLTRASQQALPSAWAASSSGRKRSAKFCSWRKTLFSLGTNSERSQTEGTDSRPLLECSQLLTAPRSVPPPALPQQHTLRTRAHFPSRPGCCFTLQTPTGACASFTTSPPTSNPAHLLPCPPGTELEETPAVLCYVPAPGLRPNCVEETCTATQLLSK